MKRISKDRVKQFCVWADAIINIIEEDEFYWDFRPGMSGYAKPESSEKRTLLEKVTKKIGGVLLAHSSHEEGKLRGIFFFTEFKDGRFEGWPSGYLVCKGCLTPMQHGQGSVGELKLISESFSYLRVYAFKSAD